MDGLGQSITFESDIYSFLKTRILLQGNIVKDLLVLISSEKGIYKEEILSKMDHSNTSVRPVLNSLYVTGFIDKEQRGRLQIYYINENGKKLLKELGGNRNEKNKKSIDDINR